MKHEIDLPMDLSEYKFKKGDIVYSLEIYWDRYVITKGKIKDLYFCNIIVGGNDDNKYVIKFDCRYKLTESYNYSEELIFSTKEELLKEYEEFFIERVRGYEFNDDIHEGTCLVLYKSHSPGLENRGNLKIEDIEKYIDELKITKNGTKD